MWTLFALVAIVICGPAHAITCSSNTSLTVVGGLTKTEAQSFVTTVNQIRMGSLSPYPESMYVLEWNNDLAQQAQSAIDSQCTSQSAPSPLPTSQREDMASFSHVGQTGPTDVTGATDRISDVLSVWNNGKYTYSDDCANAKEEGTVCGSCAGGSGMDTCLAYTQLIWAHTHSVGCGVSICNSKTYFTCLYGPTGNVVGEPPYKRGTSPISKCNYYSSGDAPSDDGGGFFDTGKEWKIPVIALGGAGVMLAGGVVYFCEGEDCSSSRDSDDSNTRRRRSPSKKVKFNFNDDASLQQLTEADDVA